MIRVRDATIDDIDTIMSLGAVMQAESVESYPVADRDRGVEYLSMAVTLPDTFLVALAEDDGVPIGLITGVSGAYSFSFSRRAASDLLFVLPEHRGGTAAMRLVRRLIGWSSDVGAESVTLSVATGVNPERTCGFFEAMGFRPMEKTFRKDL